jgi:hypothetical protein
MTTHFAWFENKHCTNISLKFKFKKDACTWVHNVSHLILTVLLFRVASMLMIMQLNSAIPYEKVSILCAAQVAPRTEQIASCYFRQNFHAEKNISTKSTFCWDADMFTTKLQIKRIAILKHPQAQSWEKRKTNLLTSPAMYAQSPQL